MTTFRTDLTPGEVAQMLGYKSPRTVVRMSDDGLLPVASWDGRGRRFREIDVLEIKLKRERSGASCGTSRARAVGGNATANAVNVPRVAGMSRGSNV